MAASRLQYSQPLAARVMPKISLQQAARAGRGDIIKEWLEFYANQNVNTNGEKKKKMKGKNVEKKQNPIDVKDSEGLAALHYAARFNKSDILAYLVLTEDPDVNIRNDHGFTPLHYAAKYLPHIVDEDEDDNVETDSVHANKKSSSTRAVDLLLQKGAMVNAMDDDGLTPLAVACQRGNYYGVERLLMEEQIDISIEDKQKSTALHEACEHGSKKIVELLLKRGAKISVANEEHVTPLHIACREGCSDVVNHLLLHGHHERDVLINAKDTQGNTALHFAVESGVESVVQALLLNGADPMAPKYNEVTPLHIAACNGYISIATLLLLYKEQSHGHFDIIEMTDRERNTPLHFAARHNQCEMIRYLVEEGAYIEALDEKSFTPLLTAVSWGKIEAVKCLLDLGAQIDAIDQFGRSGVFLAAKFDSIDILKIFAQHKDGKALYYGADSFNNHLLHVTCKHGNTKVLEYLLAMEGPKLKTVCRNDVSQTPLHLTAKYGHVQCMQQMIEANKELIPLVDDEGNTALHMACIEGYVNVAKVLIDKGAAVDARNDRKWTPKDCAANYGHTRLIQLLTDCNATVDAKDHSQPKDNSVKALKEDDLASEHCCSFCVHCRRCYRSRISTILHPCNHACLCTRCAEYLKSTKVPCPLCKQSIRSVSPVNFP